mgnify:CR=1 FL=1
MGVKMILQAENIEIDKNKVLKFLGYGKREVPEIILKKADEEIKIANKFLNPQIF